MLLRQGEVLWYKINQVLVEEDTGPVLYITMLIYCSKRKSYLADLAFMEKQGFNLCCGFSL